MADDRYDLVVIGGGPAGYAGAIRAGQLGKRVACIELERAGGTCLNWGCIPSKALLQAAETYQAFQNSGNLGVTAKEVSFDFQKVMDRSRDVSGRMAKGVEFLFKKNKVEYILGHGRVAGPQMVEITEGERAGEFLKADNILIATGCRARGLPGLEFDGTRVMSSREILACKEQPESIIIVGAGAIGVEFAYFLNALGTDVTLVEMLPQIVPIEDDEISKALARAFKKQGIDVRAGTRVENIQIGAKEVSVDLVKGDTRETKTTSSLLLAIGVVANTEGLLGRAVDLDFDERGYIKVDDHYRSNLQGIYAAGDIIGPPWLAHVATYEAVQAVNGMFGHARPKRVDIYPGCTYCHPQVASVGLTERAASEQGLDYRVGKFPFTAAGKAVAMDQAEGFVKLVLANPHGEILGAHIIGPEATELIAEYVLAMKSELTAEEVHGTIHAHPTLTEALGEAAAAAFGEAIHI